MSDEEVALKDETTKKTKRRPRGEVRLFGKWCKGCGLCIAFCPQGVFEANGEGRPVVAHPEKCTACEWCVVHCPDFAIQVHRLDDQEGEG
ncbi:MAG: 4Fe-4S binding protein [Chloroflexi bacterium]|nr:4Fe-4S binding protein [Chloroflexota bacterium]